MRFVEAFNSLGYEVPVPRTDWSSEKADGVCLSLWKSEVDWAAPPSFDLFKLHTPGQTDWENLPGAQKRARHLGRAMEEFDGWVDVVLLTGVPGEGVKSADPWRATERKGHRWCVTGFDAGSGFFTARAMVPT